MNFFDDPALPPIPASADPADVARFVDARVARANKFLIHHINNKFEELQASVMAAFPEENPGVNRQAVEALIAKERMRAEFWRGMQQTMVQRGVLVVLGILAVGFVFAVKDFLQTP